MIRRNEELYEIRICGQISNYIYIENNNNDIVVIIMRVRSLSKSHSVFML